MSNGGLTANGSKDEIINAIADKLQIDTENAEKVFDLLENDANSGNKILSDGEYFYKETEIPHLPKGTLGFLTLKLKYSINLKASTVFIISSLIDTKIGLNITSFGLTVKGLKQLITKIDETSGAKCIMAEILRTKDKKANVDIFSENKGECVNNQLECFYKNPSGTCKCTQNDVKKILDALENDGVLKNIDGFYTYSPLGYL